MSDEYTHAKSTQNYNKHMMKRSILKNAVLAALLLSVTSILAAQSTKYIYLIPENHFDATDNDIQDKIISKAQKKELVIALESIEAEELFEDEIGELLSIPQGYIYGIENTFIEVFNQGLQAISFDSIAKSDPEERDLAMHLCRNSQSDLLLSILNSNNKDLFNEEELPAPLLNSPITEFVKEYQDFINLLPLELKVMLLGPEVESFEDAVWHDFIKHYLYFLKERKLDTYLSKELQPNEEELAHLLNHLDDAENFFDIYQNPKNPPESIKITWHNKGVIQNLDRAYLKAKEKKVPLYCTIGAAHFLGVKAGLEDMGYTVLETLEDLQDLDPTLKQKKKSFRQYENLWRDEL